MADEGPFETGRKKAEEVFTSRKRAHEKRAEALSQQESKVEMTVNTMSLAHQPELLSTHETAGFLVAVGDSWFDYPYFDVLKLLEDEHGYDVHSAAHYGDAIEQMAYQGGQLDKFARCLEKVKYYGGVPKAVLISGGGNDIAGDGFGMLLNNFNSAIKGLNMEVVDGVLNQRVFLAYKSIIASINYLCQQYFGKRIPILIHGYDYPVPDGRGFLTGWGPLPGPWLRPGFEQKHFTQLSENVGLMKELMDIFHRMLLRLVEEPEIKDVHYIDLRGVLSYELTDSKYEKWWDNELHPTEIGFRLVANKFATELAKLASSSG